MNDKKGLLVGVGIVAVLFVLAAPWLRRVMVELAAQDVVLKLGRYPNPDQIIGLRDELAKIPTKYFVDPAKVKVDVAVEERSMGAAGIWRFVKVKLDYGQTVTREHRFETSVNDAFFETLEANDVPVTRVTADDDEDDEGDEDDE